MLGKIESRRRRGWQRMRWLDGITNSMDTIWARSGRWWRTGKPGVLQSTESQRVGNYWATEQQQRDFFSQIYLESWFPSPVLANLLKVFLKVTSFYVNQYYIKKMIRLYFYESSFCFRYRIYSLLFVISAAQCPLLQITYDWGEFLLLLLCPCKVLTISIVILCALLMI